MKVKILTDHLYLPSTFNQ